MSKIPIDNIPESYIESTKLPELFVYDLKMNEDAIKTKVNLNMHMFSFLQTGKKQVHFAEGAFLVDNSQSILIKKGNCLWSELLDSEETYYCKLLFFSEEKLKEFFQKHSRSKEKDIQANSCYVIENDDYIESYLNSLNTIKNTKSELVESLLAIKFDELLVYLITKYGESFEDYLFSLISKETSPLKKTIEKNLYTSLTLDEIAFLCNMSLSTFKRHFIKEYKESPGKWFRNKRLNKAKELLEKGNMSPSDVYLDLGYNNLSNFSAAFKNQFGINPSEI